MSSCPYCNSGDSQHRDRCPRSGDPCSWCCDSCCSRNCAKGINVTLYPAAQRLAWQLVLDVDASPASALESWAREYAEVFGRSPSEGEGDSARAVLEARITEGELPPLPPSASSTAWRVPKLATLKLNM